MNPTELDLWFVREVPPLEATLLLYFYHNGERRTRLLLYLAQGPRSSNTPTT